MDVQVMTPIVEIDTYDQQSKTILKKYLWSQIVIKKPVIVEDEPEEEEPQKSDLQDQIKRVQFDVSNI